VATGLAEHAAADKGRRRDRRDKGH